MSRVGLMAAMLLASFGCMLQSASAAALPKEARVNFHSPARAYQRAAGEWSIYLEQSLATGDKALSDRALEKLTDALTEIFAVLPGRPAGELRKIPFYLMWGVDAPGGGRSSGMSYIRAGEPNNHPDLDPRWNHVIVIYSASNLMYLPPVWTRKALMHELAHAWHVVHWPEKYEPISSAYRTALSRGLYRNIRDRNGKVISEAYALHNPLEYFAELSAIYFVGGNYFPFDRAGLADYDRAGELMVRTLWAD
jgi:hypothetical protein